MNVRPIPPDVFCASCTEEIAEFEISPVFLDLPHNKAKEICLCKYCFAKLKRQINNL